MNQHDDVRAQDHGWVDPVGTGILTQTLGAMAGGVDAASPTGPAATLTAMSRRVRRRRTAKVGGLGGGALALAAVLVLGATQLAPPDRSEPLPGTSSSSPAPSASPDIPIRDGYQPALLRDTELACGANLRDIVFAPDARLVAGDPESTSYYADGAWSTGQTSVPVGVDGNTSEQDVQAPTLVWTDAAGWVVDLGWWEDRSPMYMLREDGEPEAYEDGTSSCLPEGSDGSLPDGTYDVFPTSIEYAGSRLLFTDEPLEVTVENGQAHWGPGGQEAPVSFEVPGDPDRSLVEGAGLGSAVVDRTGTWERRDTYRVIVPDPEALAGNDYKVEAWCSSTDPSDTVAYAELGAWGGVSTGGDVPCTGEKVTIDNAAGYEPPVIPDTPEGVELTKVPDTVVLAYVRLVPAG